MDLRGLTPASRKLTPEGWLWWTNRAYFGAGGLAAFFTVMTVVAGAVQYYLNDTISAAKDRATEIRLAELRKETALANQKAEEERLARVKIEERLAPRTISDAQNEKLVADLSKFAGTPVAIWMAGESLEIGALSLKLFFAFASAHWTVDRWTWTGLGPIAGIGVSVKDGSNKHIVAAAEGLSAALSAAGLPCSVTPWPGGNAWENYPGMLNGPPGATNAPIRLIIGAKPGL